MLCRYLGSPAAVIRLSVDPDLHLCNEAGRMPMTVLDAKLSASKSSSIVTQLFPNGFRAHVLLVSGCFVVASGFQGVATAVSQVRVRKFVLGELTEALPVRCIVSLTS